MEHRRAQIADIFKAPRMTVQGLLFGVDNEAMYVTDLRRSTGAPVSDTVDTLILDLLEWLGPSPRRYAEVLEAWRTSCPRMPVWEDANDRGFIARHHAPRRARWYRCPPPGGAIHRDDARVQILRAPNLGLKFILELVAFAAPTSSRRLPRGARVPFELSVFGLAAWRYSWP